jgi:uncharacterized damage-inducible protein DinB
MNKRLYAAAGRLGDAERRAPKGAFWGSIHGTLVHLLWGDSHWMSRFDGWPRPATPIKESDHFIEDFTELCVARDKAVVDISRWAGRGRRHLARRGHGVVQRRRRARGPRPEAAPHHRFFDHQTHHRGQAHALLTAAGQETGGTDLFLIVPPMIA